MNQFYLILSLSVISQALFAQTGTESKTEKKRTSPSRSTRRPIVDRPKELLPSSENPFHQPMPAPRSTTAPQSAPTPQEQVPVLGISGTGKVHEEDVSDPWVYAPTKRHLNRWYRNIDGFRMFVDKGATFGFGKNANHRLDWYGVFGYQFDPMYFVGIGQGYALTLSSEKASSAPTFVNARVNFMDENVTPFLDLKLGYSTLESKGVFINPNFGVSFAKNKRAWNLSAGYSLQKAEFKRRGIKYKHTYHGISVKVTYEFSLF